ncbi:hypothetical protein F7725_027019 [Dissostichus mawsoni]|uniref:Myb/SANT-like DNA-binding domain-containing protein n=1 Tax=Dissostichus mawsoni TaxID=36200 RepID=A0A7J5X8N1_DISMA|nr:hypothetical protein F7725_027019 [Dissostichus mawsoni]
MATECLAWYSLITHIAQGTKEQTEAFIRLCVEHRHLFTGGRDTAANGYRTIVAKMGIEGRVTHVQAKQKWDNLKNKYKV